MQEPILSKVNISKFGGKIHFIADESRTAAWKFVESNKSKDEQNLYLKCASCCLLQQKGKKEGGAVARAILRNGELSSKHIVHHPNCRPEPLVKHEAEQIDRRMRVEADNSDGHPKLLWQEVGLILCEGNSSIYLGSQESVNERRSFRERCGRERRALLPNLAKSGAEVLRAQKEK